MVRFKLLRYGQNLDQYIRSFIEYAEEFLDAEVNYYSMVEDDVDFAVIDENDFYSLTPENTCAVISFKPRGVPVVTREGKMVEITKGDVSLEETGEETAEEEVSLVFVNATEADYLSWSQFMRRRVEGERKSIGVIILPDAITSLDEVEHYKKLMWNLQKDFRLSLSYTRELKETLPGGLLLTLLTLTSPGMVNIDAADMEYFCKGGLILLPLTAFSEGEGDLPSRLMNDVIMSHRRAVEFKSVKGAVINVFITEEVSLKDVVRVMEGVRRLLPQSARIITGINLESGERRMGLLLLVGMVPNELLMHLYAS